MIDFKKKIKQKSVKQSDSPIDIYLGLDRTNLAGPLRSSQEKVLKVVRKEKFRSGCCNKITYWRR